MWRAINSRQWVRTTVGDTLEETKLNVREAIEGHLETMREFGDPIPEPSSVVGEVEVESAA